jgi:hypothetical protein
MKDHDFRSFEEFWPHYLREHSKKGTRTLHFVGTTLAVSTAAAGLLLRRPALLLAAPVLGYGLSWIGHFFVEHNRPATFSHPLWSLQGDFKMWGLIASGAIDAELERVTASNGAHEGSTYAAPDPTTVN